MEYVKGEPYFVARKEKIRQFNYLNGDLICDVLIIGGGIDGAVANYFLSKKYNVALVEKSRLGHCATSCATSLLEYQLDDYAESLKKYFKQGEIEKIYLAGIYGIEKMEKLINYLKVDCFFHKRPSFLYSNCCLDRKGIKNEYEFRIKRNLQCRLLTSEDNPFDFAVDSGLFCENGGAEVDPYLFEKTLIENSNNLDCIFENTKVNKIDRNGNGFVCQTAFGDKIFCKEIVLATGFNFGLSPDASRLCKKVVSFTIVTNPLKDLRWYKDALIQDCKKPYHYLRFLPDDRIIFGGEDCPLKYEISDKKAEKAYYKLHKNLKKMFSSSMRDIVVDYKFCGAFGETDNNLGVIGRDRNGIINFFSCGANGIVNSMFGIEIVEKILQGESHPLAGLFSPLRK